MGQVANLKSTWNLAPVSQIVQTFTENYCPCLYLPNDQVWWLHDLWLKRYTSTHRDITDLVNHGMIKNTKTWINWERNIIFLWNKKNLNLCFRWHILRSYRFVAEVTFKYMILSYNRNRLLFLQSIYDLHRSNHQKCSLRKGALRNFAKFTGKYLYRSLYFNKVAVKKLWHKCFLWISRNF